MDKPETRQTFYRRWERNRLRATGCLCLPVVMVAACGCDVLVNQTASFGSTTAGQRGDIRVLVINNTTLRAVFTMGTFDQTDTESQPDLEQFGPGEFDITLDGDSESNILTLGCARVFSIGSPGLLELIDSNLSNSDLVDEALVSGVRFFRVIENDDDTESPEPVLSGTAPGFEALLGVDFPCNALLIIRLEPDGLSPDSFRIDFELIPPDSTR